MKRYELKPNFDGAKSFYKKAYVYEQDGNLFLVSYNSCVAKLTKAGRLILWPLFNCSKTTARHVWDFVNTYKKDFIYRWHTGADALRMNADAVETIKFYW